MSANNKRGTRRGRRAALMLAAVMLAAAACGGDAEDSDEASQAPAEDAKELPEPAADSSDRWLEVAVSADVSSYNPYGRTGDVVPVIRNMYEPLVDYDSERNPVPVLAESYTISDDQASVVVVLREGVTFHNGETLTAEHVVQNYEAVTDPAIGGLLAGVVQDVVEVKALDSHTVEFTLDGPRDEELITEMLTFVPIGFPDNQVNVGDAGIGTGPFRQGDREPGVSYSLERFDEYWGEKAKVAGVNFQVIADTGTAASALQSGEVHVLFGSEYSTVPTLDQVARRVDDPFGAGTLTLFVNPQRPPFDRVEVRHALSRAVNRNAIAEQVYFGVSEAKVLPWPPDSSAYDRDLANEYDFDLSAAADGFAAAGVSSLDDPIYVVSGFPDFIAAAEVIQQALSEIGVSVDVEVIEFPDFAERVGGGNYSAMIFGIGFDNRHPSTLTQMINFRTSNNPIFEGGSPPDDYVGAAENARSALTEDQRSEAFNELNEAIVRMSTGIFIASRPIVTYEAENVRGVAQDVDARPLFGEAFFIS